MCLLLLIPVIDQKTIDSLFIKLADDNNGAMDDLWAEALSEQKSTSGKSAADQRSAGEDENLLGSDYFR